MKVLVTAPCAVPSIDGPQHLEANTVHDLEVEVVHAVVHAGKGLYVDRKDDPSRIKSRVASEALVEAVRQAHKAAAKSAKSAEA